MLISRERSLLLVIDAQERLLPRINDGGRVLDNCVKLVKVAQRLRVPVVCTEHYPQGLGLTASPLRDLVDESAIAPKVSFSAVKEGCLDGRAGMERPQVIVCGAETHVCVLQTALDLKRSGKNVFVVADAAGSRTSADRDFALLRFQQNGIDIVSTEMVMFEWLERAGTDEFRSILREFIR